MTNKKQNAVKVDEQMVANIEQQNNAIANEIVHLMARDGLNWCKDWQYIGANVGISGSSGKPYRGRNAFITGYIQQCIGSDDPRWFTEGTLRKNGYVIDDDATPAYIEKWKPVKYNRQVKYTDEDGNEQVKWVTWRYMKLVGGWVVYNAADVYGLPEYAAPEFVTVTDDAGLIADEFIKTSRCPIDEYDGDRAYYSPATDDIHVPARKYFNDNAGFLRTLLHEMTHSTMKPLKRREMTSWGDDAYAFEELVAELGSAFTAAAVGFNIDDAFLGDKTYADNHAAYIKSWVSHFDDEPETIFKAAALANAACLYHLDRLHGTDADATDETDADVA